jgi:ribosome-associated toxin RatA of RatAB toxin-antitoxin module
VETGVGEIRGFRSIDLAAHPKEAFAVLADFDRYPQWQSTVKAVNVLDRDAKGRGTLVELRSDAVVRTVRHLQRYEFEEHSRLTWEYVDGDVRSLTGEWLLEELSGERTRATYRLAVDPGRKLGLLLRGPMADRVRDHVLGSTLNDLKAHLERS